MATDRNAERLLMSRYRHSLKHLQQLIMDADDCAKNHGKKTLFGGDKFAQKFEKFKETLVKCIYSVQIDNGIPEDSEPMVSLSAINDAMQELEATYSSWPMAFDFWGLFFSGVITREEGLDSHTQATENILSANSADDEILFEIAANELCNNTMRPGLWAKALAEANMDDNVAKAHYLKLRVESLEREIVNIIQLEQANSKESERQRIEQLEERRKLYERWRINRAINCPHCVSLVNPKVLEIQSETVLVCPSCGLEILRASKAGQVHP